MNIEVLRSNKELKELKRAPRESQGLFLCPEKSPGNTEFHDKGRDSLFFICLAIIFK